MAIYRSYEVLVEETAENHKTRRAEKTKKDFKPHHENTCRALKVTHELFQDAVCYYILCLVGLVKNERDKDGEPINRMWEYLHCDSKTNTILSRLASHYQEAPFHEASDIQEFFSKTYGWMAAETDKPAPASLLTTYRILFQQAVKADSEEDQSASLENLKTFAGNWIAILCNENGDTTIPGQGVFDRLHRKLSTDKVSEPGILWKIIEDFARDALREKNDADAGWQQREAAKINAKNAKSKKQKSDEELSKLCHESLNKKLQSDREALKASFLKAFSASKIKKYCSLNPEAVQQAIAEIESATCDDKRFLRLRFGARDNNMEQPLFRYLWLRENAKYGDAVAKDLLEYVAKEKPEIELQNDEGEAVSKMPYQKTGKEPLFPYFTNCLGIKHTDRAAWFEFDKSAFKRASEEVFKYKLRSDEREKLITERKQKVDALNAEVHGDPRKPLMEQLLASLGGAIGYGMRRATIGGWADLRQEFLKIAKKGEPIDEDELLAAIEKAREKSGGGFGSGAFFKALCDEEYHPLWLPEWENKQPYHPRNFVRWWVLYSEAKEELKKVWDEEASPPKPKSIAFTWPGAKNKHGEISFRPLDFDILVTPTPVVDLFDRRGAGQPIKLVQTNATPPKKRKSTAVEPPTYTDADGNALYPLTLTYRRLKRDRIVNAEGSSVEAEYATPLIVGKSPKFPRKEKDKEKPLDSSASLLPSDKYGCWHFMLSFKLEREMQKKLVDDAASIPGEKDGSVRKVKKNGKWVGLNMRWPIDEKTEKKMEEDAAPADVDKIKDTDVKFNIKKLWCSYKFEPFDILSVDLGVRYAGAWCRGRVKVGRDADRPHQRTISPADHAHEIIFDAYDKEQEAAEYKKLVDHAHEIIFDAYDFGTFRLQGEDAKNWRKDKHMGFGGEPAQEKCGSRGRIATDAEKAEFTKLAGQVFPATIRLPIPSEPDDLKFYPDLGNHLVYRLSRRLGRLRFLFKLRWQINGKKKKVGHEYKTLDGDELKTFRGEQRFNVISSLVFIPKDDKPEEVEDAFMRNLRLALAPDDRWSTLIYKHDGETHPLFAKIKGGRTKEEKEKSKKLKGAQKAAWANLKQELQSNATGKWDWNALARTAETELRDTMKVFAGEHSLIAEVARFVWPLQDKRWKWNNCTITKDGEIEQSFLERDDSSNEPKRFIHGMRGLNMKRISLMQNFRQCCQSLAKLERRFYAEENHGLEPSPVQPGDRVHEPTQAFLDKINELREQRVNQTAHMILAEALGLELMNPAEVMIDGKSKWELKSERDLHGRYKQKKRRVAAIVMEDLSRYRTSQDRSRYENSQLMEWSHRKIIGKLQDMAQVFGIQIITVDARFSSRFCSLIGVPGIRCAQVTKGFDSEYPWKKWKEEKDAKQQPTERAEMILLAAEKLNLSNSQKEKTTLVLPMDGGPAFFPVVSHNPDKEGIQENADINAAVNIGLRSVAHPDRLDIFPVLRTEAKDDGKLEIKNRRGSLSEPAKPKAEDRTVKTVALVKEMAEQKAADGAEDDSGSDEELESGKFPYLYAAVKVGSGLLTLSDECRYQLPMRFDGFAVSPDDATSVSAAKGKDYWSRVKDECWKRIKHINAERLLKMNVTPPAESDGKR